MPASSVSGVCDGMLPRRQGRRQGGAASAEGPGAAQNRGQKGEDWARNCRGLGIICGALQKHKNDRYWLQL